MTEPRPENLGRTAWLGRVNVIPRADHEMFGRVAGAWVTTLAVAGNAKEFQAVVETALHAIDLDAQTFEAVESLQQWTAREQENAEIAELARSAVVTGDVQFHTFHFYLEDDA